MTLFKCCVNKNVNVTSINLNDNSNNDTSSSGNNMPAVAGNVIGDNMYLLESEEQGDAGRKKHAFWDTQVSYTLLIQYGMGVWMWYAIDNNSEHQKGTILY